MEEKNAKNLIKEEPAQKVQEEKVVVKSVEENTENQKVLRLTQISLLLDEYEDIFSDFDPSPYSKRELSDDFLSETKKATRQKASGEIELRFLMPAHLRKPSLEQVIKKRIREHFKMNLDSLKKEKEEMIRKGLWFVTLGIIIMGLATTILYKFSEHSIFTSFLIVLLEPAGWFLTWGGLDYIIFKPETIKQSLDFYSKMANSEISFLSY